MFKPCNNPEPVGIWYCEQHPGIKIFAAMDGGPFPESLPFFNSLESVMYTFTKREPFLKPWLWNRRSLPGRKWRQSRPKWQPKFIQVPHSSRTLQSNNTWNSCSYKWRSSGKNHLKTFVIFRKVLQNWLRVQAKTCAVSKVRSENILMSYLFLKIFFSFPVLQCCMNANDLSTNPSYK